MQKRKTANKDIMIIKQIRCGPTSHDHRSMTQMDPKLWVIVEPVAHEMFCHNTRIRMNVLVSPKAKSTCLHLKLVAPSGQGGGGAERPGTSDLIGAENCGIDMTLRVSRMILWGILRPKPHLRYRTGSETAAVPKICRSNMIFCKFHCLNTFDSLAQKCGCVRTLQCCG